MDKNTTTILIIVIIAALAVFALTQKGCSLGNIFNQSNDSFSAGGNNGDQSQTPDQNPDQTPDTDELRCIDYDGNDIWKASHVDDTLLKVSYPDVCKNEPFKIYLYEKICVDGLPSQVEVNCWDQGGAICDSGACVKPSCSNIINPNSQADCDIGHASCSESPYTYCKYYAPTTQAPSKCVCTIDPSTVDTCDESCLFYQGVDGYCADPMQKVPCGSNTHYINYDSLCPIYQGILHRACCCRN